MILKLLLKTQMTWMIFINYNKYKLFFVFDSMIANILINKKFHQLVTELFITDRKLNMSPVFMIESYFAVTKKLG